MNLFDIKNLEIQLKELEEQIKLTESEKDEAIRLSQKICSKFMIAMIRKNLQFTFTDKFEDVFNSKAFEAIMGTSNQDEKVDKLIEFGLC